MEVPILLLLLQPALPSAGVWQYPAYNAPIQAGDPPFYNAPVQRGAPTPTRATRAAMPQDLVSGEEINNKNCWWEDMLKF